MAEVHGATFIRHLELVRAAAVPICGLSIFDLLGINRSLALDTILQPRRRRGRTGIRRALARRCLLVDVVLLCIVHADQRFNRFNHTLGIADQIFVDRLDF